MAQFEVVYEGSVREVYIVEAESEADARANWMDGFLESSEVYDGEVESVEEMDD